MKVYLNRSGKAESQVELSERELRPFYNYRHENSGLSLRIVWRVLGQTENDVNFWSSYDSPQWFDETKLRELEFQIPNRRDERQQLSGRVHHLPKKVFVVLENDSPLHSKVLAFLEDTVVEASENLQKDPDNEDLKSVLEGAQKRLKDERDGGSRLFAVDAGLEAESLRQQYPDRTRYIITRAIVRMIRDSHKRETVYRGQIQKLVVSKVNVARTIRDKYDYLDSSKTSNWKFGYHKLPRFNVTLAYGRAFEPWVIDFSEIH